MKNNQNDGYSCVECISHLMSDNDGLSCVSNSSNLLKCSQDVPLHNIETTLHHPNQIRLSLAFVNLVGEWPLILPLRSVPQKVGKSNAGKCHDDKHHPIHCVCGKSPLELLCRDDISLSWFGGETKLNRFCIFTRFVGDRARSEVKSSPDPLLCSIDDCVGNIDSRSHSWNGKVRNTRDWGEVLGRQGCIVDVDINCSRLAYIVNVVVNDDIFPLNQVLVEDLLLDQQSGRTGFLFG